ncbi:hypothetical protein ACHAXT_010933 [Thalassiosira profunda]
MASGDNSSPFHWLGLLKWSLAYRVVWICFSIKNNTSPRNGGAMEDSKREGLPPSRRAIGIRNNPELAKYKKECVQEQEWNNWLEDMKGDQVLGAMGSNQRKNGGVSNQVTMLPLPSRNSQAMKQLRKKGEAEARKRGMDRLQQALTHDALEQRVSEARARTAEASQMVEQQERVLALVVEQQERTLALARKNKEHALKDQQEAEASLAAAVGGSRLREEN